MSSGATASRIRNPSLAALMVLLLGCEGNIDEHDHAASATGKDLYELHCAGCHGKSGKGNLMQGIPSNLFTDFSRAQVVELIIAGPKMNNETCLPCERCRAMKRG
jgi:mono/diheme cytochrome c family protein